MPGGVRLLRLQDGEGAPVFWVSAEDFMRVQKERDDQRRVLALLNETLRCKPFRASRDRVVRAQRLLEDAGWSDADADAMHGLLVWARSELGVPA